jgi:hypothetical protein
MRVGMVEVTGVDTIMAIMAMKIMEAITTSEGCPGAIYCILCHDVCL